jgi:hypothetical protein
MKIKTRTVFELLDIDGQKSLTFKRHEAKGANEKGFEVLERKIITCRVSRKKEVITMITKSW